MSKSDGAPPKQARIETIWFLIILVIAAIPRLCVLAHGGGVIDSDEAIVGLMAKHINEGRDWPVFYYGQPYMGSLEAFAAALMFQLFGQTGFVLKLVPFVFSLIHPILIFALAQRVIGQRYKLAALGAAMLTAVGPAGLIQWSSMARGGFIELVVLGTISLILAVDILFAAKPSSFAFFKLAAILGLGWWLNNQIVFYMVPIAVVFAVELYRRFGLSESLRWLGVSLAGFLLGGMPFWWANITARPRWPSFDILFGSQGPTTFIDHLQGFFTEALPIIFGARRFWSTHDIFPGATVVGDGLYLLVFAIVIWALLQEKDRSRRAALAIFPIFIVAVCLIFSKSGFGWLSRAPRYLLPLYSVLPVMVAVSAVQLWEKGAYEARAIAIAIPGILLCVNAVSLVFGGPLAQGQPYVYQSDRVTQNQGDLYNWLAAHHYNHIWTNYWIGYRVAFETDEKITFTREGSPRTLRIPEYEAASRDLSGEPVYVLVPSEAAEIEADLEQTGLVYRRSEVSGYVVLDQLRPSVNLGKRIKIEPSEVTTTSRQEWAGNLVDGELGTRWGSGAPQAPGMAIEVNFATARVIAGLSLDYGFFVTDAPRDLMILGKLPSGEWCLLSDLRGTDLFYDLANGRFDEIRPTWEFVFPPRALLGVRLEERSAAKVFDWSIAELSLFAPAEPGDDPSEVEDSEEVVKKFNSISR